MRLCCVNSCILHKFGLTFYCHCWCNIFFYDIFIGAFCTIHWFSVRWVTILFCKWLLMARWKALYYLWLKFLLKVVLKVVVWVFGLMFIKCLLTSQLLCNFCDNSNSTQSWGNSDTPDVAAAIYRFTPLLLSLCYWYRVVAWRSGNALHSNNKVTLRWAGLVLRWVTAYRQVNHLGM